MELLADSLPWIQIVLSVLLVAIILLQQSSAESVALLAAVTAEQSITPEEALKNYFSDQL